MLLRTRTALLLSAVGLTLLGSLAATLPLPAAQKKGAPPKKGATKPPVKGTGGASNAADITAGKQVYTTSGCATCHAIGGKGGTSAPDLSNTGGNPNHTAKWLQTQVNNPKANNPGSTMPPFPQI